MKCFNDNDRRWGRWAAIAIATSGLIVFGAISASADSHEGGWKTTSWLGYEGQGKTDLDKSDLEFDFWMIAGGLKSQTKLNESLGLSLGGDYRAVGYDFSKTGGLGDPWGTIHVARFNPMLNYAFNEKWFVTGGPSIQISAEGGADAGDSITAGGAGGVGYKFSDNFTVALGVVATSQIEDSAWIQPFILINYCSGEGTICAGVEAHNSRGGEFRLTYALNESWEFGIGGGLRRERFRLDDDDLAKDGVGEEEAKVVKLSVTYNISKTMSIEGYGGTSIDGEFRLEDEDGDKIAKSDYDNAGYGGVQLKFRF